MLFGWFWCLRAFGAVPPPSSQLQALRLLPLRTGFTPVAAWLLVLLSQAEWAAVSHRLRDAPLKPPDCIESVACRHEVPNPAFV